MGEIWLGIEKKSITRASWISECLNKCSCCRSHSVKLWFGMKIPRIWCSSLGLKGLHIPSHPLWSILQNCPHPATCNVSMYKDLSNMSMSFWHKKMLYKSDQISSPPALYDRSLTSAFSKQMHPVPLVWFSLVCMNILAVFLERSHDFLHSAW